MKARPEVVIAALEGRLVDVESALEGLRSELTELSKRMDEADRRWEALKSYESYRAVHRQRRSPVADTGEV